jgi:hypothetical protein
VYITLLDVFLCVFCAKLRFSAMFDTFPEPRSTLSETKHLFSEPQYVPVCRMYVTPIVNMLLLYVSILLVGCCTFRLYEIIILYPPNYMKRPTTTNFNFQYFIFTERFEPRIYIRKVRVSKVLAFMRFESGFFQERR